MSLEFYEIAPLVQMAYAFSPYEAVNVLVQLRDKASKMGNHTEAEIMHQAMVQLANGESLQVIHVDGSANAPAQAQAEPQSVEVQAVQEPTPDAQPRRRRKL